MFRRRVWERARPYTSTLAPVFSRKDRTKFLAIGARDIAAVFQRRIDIER
jgi:hypothetical protein